MADTTTAPGVDRKPLIAYLRIQRASDREVLTALRKANGSISAELRRLEKSTGIGAAVRRDQLQESQIAIQQEMARLWDSVGRTVLAGRAAASAAGIESNLTALKTVLPRADYATLARSAKAGAGQGIEAVEARLNISRIPLSGRVYTAQSLTTGKIDELINSALARGASARELARDVRAYVNPNTPGGARYAALRLGRTELNNAFHAMQVSSGIAAPWVEGLKWNLSGSHPRPDECNTYAETQHTPGGDPGVYRPEEVPPKPHPNCLCFTTPEVIGEDDFIRGFERGAYDPFIDRIMRDGSMVFR